MNHKEFSVGEVAVDPFHHGVYGRGAFIVTGVENKQRFGKDTQLLDVIYLDAKADGETYVNSATRGINGSNRGKIWGNSVKVRFNSVVSPNAKRIRAKSVDIFKDSVEFEVLEYNQ